MVDCPACFQTVEPAVLTQSSGGRIAWWCENCKSLYPDDDYVAMKRRPLGMPHD